MKLYIKYMVSQRCKMVVKEILASLRLSCVMVDLGEIELKNIISDEKREALKKALAVTGLELMDDKRAVLIEKIKNVIIELVHYTETIPKINYSEYISQKLNHDYTYLANIFSEVKGITIQQFIIIHKIERAKELLIYDEMNLTQISYVLDYSSVSHLSNQFKKITGLSPSHFKQLKNKRRLPIENLGNNEIL